MSRPQRRSKSAPAKTAAAAAEEPTVVLFGGLPGGLTQIRASQIRLLVTFGERNDGTDVLVPLVDWRLYGQEVVPDVEPDADDKGVLLASRLIAFDNLAFLMQDLAFDTRDAVRLLAVQSRGGISPVDERISYSARMLRLASRHLLAAADELDEISPDVTTTTLDDINADA